MVTERSDASGEAAEARVLTRVFHCELRTND